MSRTTRILAAGALAAGIVLGAAPSSAQQRNCIDTLAGMREFSQVVNTVTRTHLVNEFRMAHQITIFAPTNEALRNVDPMLRDRLFPMAEGGRQPDPLLAPAAVGAHVVLGTLNSAALRAGTRLTSVAGTPLATAAEGQELVVRGVAGTEARVTQTDIPCANGVIHAISAPLIR